MHDRHSTGCWRRGADRRGAAVTCHPGPWSRRRRPGPDNGDSGTRCQPPRGSRHHSPGTPVAEVPGAPATGAVPAPALAEHVRHAATFVRRKRVQVAQQRRHGVGAERAQVGRIDLGAGRGTLDVDAHNQRVRVEQVQAGDAPKRQAVRTFAVRCRERHRSFARRSRTTARHGWTLDSMRSSRRLHGRMPRVGCGALPLRVVSAR